MKDFILDQKLLLIVDTLQPYLLNGIMYVMYESNVSSPLFRQLSELVTEPLTLTLRQNCAKEATDRFAMICHAAASAEHHEFFWDESFENSPSQSVQVK